MKHANVPEKTLAATKVARRQQVMVQLLAISNIDTSVPAISLEGASFADEREEDAELDVAP